MNMERLRKEQRKATQQPVHFRNRRGLAASVWMLNLSPSGCQVQLQFGSLDLGEAVTIRPAGFEGFAGYVRWVNGNRAGIEFSPALHQSVAEHIASLVVTSEHLPKRFGMADSLGQRLLPGPNVNIFRSVA